MASARVYLDHAATTPVDPEVLKSMLPYFTEEFGNPSSIHETGHRASQALLRSRERVATVLGCRPNEVLFTSGGTESDNLALKGIAELNKFSGHLITSAIEHHAVLDTAKYLATRGVEVTFLPVDSLGRVTPQAVLDAVRDDTFLVSIMYVNNEVGTIEPIQEIGSGLERINRERAKTGKPRLVFHTDAVQAAGLLPLTVNTLHADMLSLSGHKFYAPKGVGILYVRNGIELARQQIGGGQEFKKRASTENVPGIVGLSRALERAEAKREKEAKRLTELRTATIAAINREVPTAILTGHPTDRLANSISFCFPELEGEALVMRLSEEGYDCSSGSACTSGNLEPSHVLLALGLDRNLALGSLRVTLGASSSQEALDRFVQVLKTEVAKLQSMSGIVDVACR